MKTLKQFTKEEKDEEFFSKLAEKLEELFEKGELCKCGRRLPRRSNALAFNAFANIYHSELLTASHNRLINKIIKWAEKEKKEISGGITFREPTKRDEEAEAFGYNQALQALQDFITFLKQKDE